MYQRLCVQRDTILKCANMRQGKVELFRTSSACQEEIWGLWSLLSLFYFPLRSWNGSSSRLIMICRGHIGHTLNPLFWERKKIFSVFKIIISGVCHSNRKVDNPLGKEYTSRWNGTSRCMKSWDFVYESQILTTISKLSKIKRTELFTYKRSFTWLLSCFLAESIHTRMEWVIVFKVL